MFMKAEFDKAGAQILVTSHGSRSAAVQWQQETSCRYPILLDAKRQVKKFTWYQLLLRLIS